MNSQDFSAKDKLTEEAAYWVSKLHNGEISREEQRAFSIWLNTSPQHIQVFDELHATWTSLGKAEYLPQIQQELINLSTSVNKRNHKLYRYSLQAACLALLVFSGFSFFLSTNLSNQPASSVDSVISQTMYETAAGEDRIIELSDGSKIHLNTRSKVLVRYSSTERHITLQQGEAFFEVMPDKSRPFIVTVAHTSVTAVGTAFNILKQANQATVTITEGIVSVKGRGDAPAEGMMVPANRKVKLIDDSIHSIEDTSTRQETAWQNKQVIFRSETIDVVIKELNRYLEKTVVIQDPTIKSLRLTGTFDMSNPEDVLQALIVSYGLEESTEQGYRFINR